MNFDKSLPSDRTWCEEVIISTTLRRGEGRENDPIRIITQVFLKDGTLVAESDPCMKETLMIKFSTNV